MEDHEIITLFLNRQEDAIAQIDRKYGNYCRHIANNILTQQQDAEECVNDTYLSAWNHIPPTKPRNLRIWLGTVVRNMARNLWQKNHTQKRYHGMDVMMEELEDCIPATENVERILETQELTKWLNTWLTQLPKESRVWFLRRYWNGEALQDIAADAKIPAAKLAQKMYALRQQLRAALEKEGYQL